MLTLRTKLALAVLHDIQYKDYQLSTSLNPSPSEITYLLQRLSKEHLITLIENQPDNHPESFRSYVPAAKAIKRTPNSTDRKSTG